METARGRRQTVRLPTSSSEAMDSHCEVVHFHGRKVVFLRGPEGITIGLSERAEGAAPGG